LKEPDIRAVDYINKNNNLDNTTKRRDPRGSYTMASTENKKLKQTSGYNYMNLCQK